MLRLVQLTHLLYGRLVAVVEHDYLRRLNTYQSVYDLAQAALKNDSSLQQTVLNDRTTERMRYTPIYNGETDWSFLPPLDHPEEPCRCLVTGTGLTHKASAANRQAMHEEEGHGDLTDRMQIYRWGLEGGRPAKGEVGVQPEWFYKGHGSILRGHGETLHVPPYADDGGEEPEIAGAYIIDPDGKPRRLGFMTANEFSDHVMEKRNYLYLAPSKLRACSVGPELIIGGAFDDLNGTVRIDRDGNTVWSKDVKTGDANMSHSVANLEHHHFKYDVHQRPGDVHVHFYGADAFSFGAGVALEDGDLMTIEWEGMGRPLRNTLKIEAGQDTFVDVEPLS
ncbi:MAG: AraD1 family protein [Gemmatimonadota bacterium]|nr:AraD1 family protein [Gemmatimonadota bacterium]